MPFTGSEDHSITLSAAAVMTKKYRDSVAQDAIIAHYFGRDAIEEILAQTNCVGIRIYHALNAADEKQLVITGVLADQNDIYEGKLAENSFLCPSLCAADNPLNSDV